MRPSATRDETENYEPSFVGLPARGNRSEKPLFRARSTRQARSLRLGTKVVARPKIRHEKRKKQMLFPFFGGGAVCEGSTSPFPPSPLGAQYPFCKRYSPSLRKQARSGDNSSRKKADRINLHKPIYRIKSGLPCLSALPIITGHCQGRAPRG